MKTIILLRGPICAGKTSVMEALGKVIPNVSVVDADALKRAIDNTHSSPWRSQLAFRVALHMTAELMKQNRTVIVDIHATKKRLFQFYALKRLAKKMEYHFHSALLYPPLTTCLLRNKKRGPVVGVYYTITDDEVRLYHKETVRIRGEHEFDTSKMSAMNIALAITKNLVR